MGIEKTKLIIKDFEKKGKVKVDWKTGTIEILCKNKKEQEKIFRQISFSSPQALLNAMK